MVRSDVVQVQGGLPTVGKSEQHPYQRSMSVDCSSVDVELLGAHPGCPRPRLRTDAACRANTGPET